MLSKKQIIERFQEWDGTVTEKDIRRILWALTVDKELHEEFSKWIESEQFDYEEEMNEMTNG